MLKFVILLIFQHDILKCVEFHRSVRNLTITYFQECQIKLLTERRGKSLQNPHQRRLWNNLRANCLRTSDRKSETLFRLSHTSLTQLGVIPKPATMTQPPVDPANQTEQDNSASQGDQPLQVNDQLHIEQNKAQDEVSHTDLPENKLISMAHP